MKHTSKHTFRPSIEPLESRIAPAILVNGPNLLGAGNPATGEMSLGDNSVTLVKVLSGQVIVWYQDGDIASVSFGQGANFEIHGDVLGDIVGNLGSDGRLSDSDGDPVNGEDGNILLPNDLAGLKMLQFSTQKGGFRYLITGGSAGNLNINGQIEGIYTGDGVFDVDSDALNLGSVVSSIGFDVNPLTAGVQDDFTFTKATSQMKSGAGVRNAVIGIGKELEIFTGGGNPSGAAPDPLKAGAPGGDIVNLTIKSAFLDTLSSGSTPSYQLKTGSGGDGKTGGKGGDIVTVIEESSVGSVFFTGGNGGAGSGGKGGDGGSLRLLEMRSDSTRYEFHAGNAGNGAPAGAGGSIITSNFTNLTTTGGIMRAADFSGDGVDDLLIVDTATGKMVIMQNDGTGTNFTPIVQHDLTEVFITPAGNTPSDVAVADMDHDGKLDIYVSYKNSSSLGIFNNQGGGVFWDIPNAAYSVQTFNYLFTPSYIIPAEFGGSSGLDYVLVEVRPGKTIVHQVVSILSFDLSREIWEVGADLGVYPSEATTVAYGSDPNDLNMFIGFKNGHVGAVRGSALQLHDAGIGVPGGVGQLDIDSSGKVLAALGTSGRDLRVYNVTGTDLMTLNAPTLPAAGKALVAHFTHDTDANTPDELAVLFSNGGNSRIDQFSVTSGPDPINPALSWSAPVSLNSLNPLKNFVAANSADSFQGYAALGAALNQISYSLNGADFVDYSLPFTGKRVFLFAGDGGTGIDVGTLAGKGGAGGSIVGLNAVATDLKVTAGKGGDAFNGGGGAGGSVANGATMITSAGLSIVPKIEAETTLIFTAGDGGSPTGVGSKTASGGAGGGVIGINGTLKTGQISVIAGNGGSGKGAAGGAGGSVNGGTFTNKGGNLILSAGNGGDASVGKFAGGAGGGINGLSYTLLSGKDAEQIESSYFATLTAGQGGNSTQGAGGAGGGAQNMTLSVDAPDRSYDNPIAAPPRTDAHVDSTFHFSLALGEGGDGIVGGKGGGMSNLRITIVHDQTHENGGVLLAYAVADVFLGDGGNGTAGNGGDGGSFTAGRFAGLTYFDPDAVIPGTNPPGTPLRIVSGNGGSGSIKGGAGGSVTSVTANNAQFGEPGASEDGGVTLVGRTMLGGAEFYGGNGGAGGTGDGGKGGDVTGLYLGVEAGLLYAVAGNGGAGLKGGAGGAVKSSTLATVSSVFDNAILVAAGNGGNGVAAGGVGGALMGLNFNAPPGKLDTMGVQTTRGEPIVLFSGKGGAASGAAGKGGIGGDINGVSLTKDIFSSISAIIAGGGGDATGTGGFGGKGGSVLNIRTVGFIGKPTDGSTKLGAFNELLHEQGLFVGRGGAGTTAGVNGSVTGVLARQISAIGAAADASGIFAAAEKVSNVKADLIGYDVDNDGVFDGATASPGTGMPLDGFLLAKVLSSVTGSRAAFTFTS